ncbi:hypothetical protein OZ411_30510 [Bradyrhizobium sp. Arg237L]|uniref:hypothetical protein n=1 Tax=Bradyrhizobium sp. Arg237L TaxID=3003352 RepID=UPI00249EE1AF|nr:hypothetical protein [Bradyrhizobium sp. Arg237L]MDI4237147.1 hypothetical protein [Bradyrhizobium sp. Arg237L]
MTIPPFYKPVVLEMPIEAYAKIAVDGGIWLAGEIVAHEPGASFVPDPAYVYKTRHRTGVIGGLGELDEARRHHVFIEGFLALPENGAKATFRRLLVTHTEMLHAALRAEWSRRWHKIQIGEDARPRALAVARQLLPKPRNVH